MSINHIDHIQFQQVGQGDALEKLWFMQSPACRKQGETRFDRSHGGMRFCPLQLKRAFKRAKKASHRKKLVRIAIAPQRHLLRAAMRTASYRRAMPRRGQADQDDGGDGGDGSPIDRSPLSLLSPLPCFSRFSSPSVPDNPQAVVVCSFALVCCVKGSSVPSTIKKEDGTPPPSQVLRMPPRKGHRHVPL